MAKQKPRVHPVELADMNEEQLRAIAPMRITAQGVACEPLNIFKTLVRAPKALTRFIGWSIYVLSKRNSLSSREREIIILRTGYVCRSGYEFTQHVRMGLEAGLSEEEIRNITRGAPAGWADKDACLIEMVDQVLNNYELTEGTWAKLAKHFDEKARMDAIFTVAQYAQVSIILNAFQVQLDPGMLLDPRF